MARDGIRVCSVPLAAAGVGLATGMRFFSGRPVRGPRRVALSSILPRQHWLAAESPTSNVHVNFGGSQWHTSTATSLLFSTLPSARGTDQKDNYCRGARPMLRGGIEH